jgi:hypothetical protein
VFIVIFPSRKGKDIWQDYLMSSFFPEKKKKKKKKKKKEKESLAQGVVVYPSREGERKFGRFASIFLPKRRTIRSLARGVVTSSFVTCPLKEKKQ